MTQPRTGPGSAGPDPESAGPTSGATATRASAGAASVPPQLGQQQGRAGYGEQTGYAQTVVEQDVPGDKVLAAAAAASWVAVLIGALCMIGLGIVLLVWPKATLTVVAILIGAALVVSGIVKLYEGFTDSAERGGMRVGYVVIGLLAVLAGLYLLRHHALSLFLVAFVTGVYFIMHGIADIGIAIAAKVPGRGVRALLGVFSLAAGLIIVIWPGPSLVLLLTIVAAWLLFYGLVLGGLAFSLRRAGKQPERRTMATPAPVT